MSRSSSDGRQPSRITGRATPVLRPMSAEESAKLANRIENLKGSEPDGISTTICVWIVTGLFLSLIAYAVLSFLHSMLSLGLEVPALLFDILLYVVTLAITLLVVWGILTGIRDLLSGQHARKKTIGNIQTDLKMGIVAEWNYSIADYFTLFDKRDKGLAYILHTGGDEVLFLWDRETFWIPTDKEESGPYDGWDPRSDAKTPRARLEVVRAPKSDIPLAFEWHGKALPAPDPLIERPALNWPVSGLSYTEISLQILNVAWDDIRHKYGAG